MSRCPQLSVITSRSPARNARHGERAWWVLPARHCARPELWWKRESHCGHPQTAGVMPVTELKRSLHLWHCTDRMAADMAVSFIMVSLLSIVVVYDLLIFFGVSFLMIELCVCVSHVLVACDDGGCVGGDVGECGHSPSWLRGVPVMPVPSRIRFPRTRVVGYGTVCWGRTQRRWHRARCTGFSDMYSLVTLTSNTAHENKNTSVGTGDVGENGVVSLLSDRTRTRQNTWTLISQHTWARTRRKHMNTHKTLRVSTHKTNIVITHKTRHVNTKKTKHENTHYTKYATAHKTRQVNTNKTHIPWKMHLTVRSTKDRTTHIPKLAAPTKKMSNSKVGDWEDGSACKWHVQEHDVHAQFTTSAASCARRGARSQVWCTWLAANASHDHGEKVFACRSQFLTMTDVDCLEGVSRWLRVHCGCIEFWTRFCARTLWPTFGLLRVQMEWPCECSMVCLLLCPSAVDSFLWQSVEYSVCGHLSAFPLTCWKRSACLDRFREVRILSLDVANVVQCHTSNNGAT